MSLKPFSESIDEFSVNSQKTQVHESLETPSQNKTLLQPFSDGILPTEDFGGEGSGFFGHKGRPGEQGGSSSDGDLLKGAGAKANKAFNKKVDLILEKTTFDDISAADINKTISKLEAGDALEEWENEYLQIGWPKLFGKIGEDFTRPSQRTFMNPNWITE